MYLFYLQYTSISIKKQRARHTWTDISVAIAVSIFWKFGKPAGQFTRLLSDFLKKETDKSYLKLNAQGAFTPKFFLHYRIDI